VDLVRTIGSPQLPQQDPFLLLDEFNSNDPKAYIAGFPNHPHRGFETVTYMLAGRMQHRDSMGNEGEIGPGDLQWMTAGRGIIHSEMPLQDHGEMRGFQLWVNLPKTHKMVSPRYQDICAKDIPVVEVERATVRVLAGHFNGCEGPVRDVHVNPTLLDVTLEPKGHITLDLPAQDQGFAYVFEGSGTLGNPGRPLQARLLATFGQGGALACHAGVDGLRILVGCARAIGEPVARYGPFVMNTQSEIRQAIEDYQAGRLDKS
jgi:redox-sensitive bicupin YhaK (pirin superfamily)